MNKINFRAVSDLNSERVPLPAMNEVKTGKYEHTSKGNSQSGDKLDFKQQVTNLLGTRVVNNCSKNQ